MTLILAPYIQCLKQGDKNLGCLAGHQGVPAVTRCSCAASSWDNVWGWSQVSPSVGPFSSYLFLVSMKIYCTKEKGKGGKGEGEREREKTFKYCVLVFRWSGPSFLHPILRLLTNSSLFSCFSLFVLNWFHKPGDFSIVIWLWAFQFHDF